METLVAMVTGLIVTGALFTIMIVAMRETTRDADYVQASRQGRATMARIVGELHSACLTAGFDPVQEKSGTKELYFVNAYSKEAEPTSATEREILFTNNELIEKTWANTTTSTYPNFVFETSKTPTTETHISEKGAIKAVEKEKPAKESEKEEPIFSYQKYAPEVTGSASTGESALETIPTSNLPFTKEGAKEAAGVTIHFRALPTDHSSEVGRPADFESEVTLALSAPRTEAKITDKPCE